MKIADLISISVAVGAERAIPAPGIPHSKAISRLARLPAARAVERRELGRLELQLRCGDRRLQLSLNS